ncbi:SGNH/GDSL hydrolase family protein [Paracoccus halophilus]|nr:SGNH/GDSL hydrolase family protein [Paracoccus halophilus]
MIVAAVMMVAGTATYVWPQPAPATSVPTLQLAPEARFTARLTAPQADLAPLPARISGTAAAGEAPGSLIHEWPSLIAEARFAGTGVTLRLDDRINRWRVSLDGAWIELSRPGTRDLRIEGLAPGEHLIRAERISESDGPAIFGGFFLDRDAVPLPAPDPRPRTIEFIGDSDTVGFGNTSKRRECSGAQIFAATDTSQSFPARLAGALGADYRVIARSGIGLLRNYGGATPDRTMRTDYPLAVPSDMQAERLPQPAAGMLVIGLGSNDFGSDIAEGEPWADHAAVSRDFGPALLEFARARLLENPGAPLILLAFGEYGDDLMRAYLSAHEALLAEGFTVRLVTLPKLQRRACLWHPSLADHEMIAETLEKSIRTEFPGW